MDVVPASGLIDLRPGRRVSVPDAGAPAFTPLSLSPYVWYDASSESFNNNDPALFTDRSGNGRHSTQATASLKPLFKTGIANGKPGLLFDSVDDFLSLPTLAAVTNATVYIVVQLLVDPPLLASKTGLWQLSNGATFACVFPWTDGVIYDNCGSNVRNTVVNPVPALTSPRNYCVTTTLNDWKAYLDGSLLATIGASTPGFPAAPELGRSDVATFLNGYIFEFLLFNSVHSLTNRQSMEGYLRSKWGLS